MNSEIAGIVTGFRGVIGLCVEDLNTGRRIDINGDKILAAGSTIKVPVLMQLFKQDAEGELDLQEPVNIGPEDIVAGSGVLQHLEGKFQLSLYNLAILMINVSDNIATNLCIDHASINETNQLMENLGCVDTVLQRKMIDWDAAASGKENLATARDMVKWLKILHKGEFVSQEISDQVISVLGKSKSSPIREAIPAEVPIAGKTGGLEGVRCEVALVKQQRRPYILGIMTAFGVDNNNSETITHLAEIIWDYLGMLDRFTHHGRGLPSQYLPQ